MHKYIRLFPWLLATLLFVLATGAGHANEASSARWFRSLPEDERIFVQGHLVLLGHYNAFMDGEFGPSTYRALTDFQRSMSSPPTGVLTERQLQRLKSDAAEVYNTLGMEVVTDEVASLSIILPTAILMPAKETARGKSYQTDDGSIRIDTTRKPFAEESFADLFTRLSTDTRGRRITYTSFRPARFVVSGRSGSSSFYSMFYNADDASIGFTISWTEEQQFLGSMLATFSASIAFPLDEGSEDEETVAAAPEGRGEPPPSSGTGSGFFFAPKGMIVTNQHVVDRCDSVSIMGYGPATVLKSDKKIDLAVLQLDNERVHSWAHIRSTPPVLGEDVVLLGYPLADLLNSSLNVGTGIVSAEKAVGEHPDWFATNAGIQPGNSGGPVLDRRGNVIGVAVAKANDLQLLAQAGTVAPNIGFAISSTKVLDFISVFRHTADSGDKGDAASVQDVVARSRGFTVKVVCTVE